MLQEIGIENFKPFGAPQRAPLSALTLIYGPNSSGKSSIIQALLMMRQSMETLGFLGPNLVTRGEYVDLGSFKSLLHQHDPKRQLSLSFKYSKLSTEQHYSRRLPNPEFTRKITTSFRIPSSAKSKTHHNAELFHVNYTLDGPTPVNIGLTKAPQTRPKKELDLPLLTANSVFNWENDEAWRSLANYLASLASPSVNLSTSPPTAQEYEAFLQKCSVLAFEGLPTRVTPKSAKLESENFNLRHRAAQQLNAIVAEYYALISSFFYLGPLRSHPARHYLVMGGQKDTVGARGEFAPQLIYKHKRKIEKQINRWFEEFEIPYKLKVRSVGNEVTGELITLTLTDSRNQVEVAPSDVGFGIGQLLPIIVEGVISKNRILCVEQPEIHLHPRLQASVADLLIETAGISLESSRLESSRQPRNQWIVETHSEALMLRLQRRIREGIISHKDVSVIYVEPTAKGGSQILNLRLDEHGDFIDEWPDGFFEEGYREQFGTK